MNNQNYQPNSILRLTQIIGCKKRGIAPILPVCRSTFLNQIKTGLMPSPIRLGEKAVGWRYGELMSALDKLQGGAV
jgi:prophage regulatory protein